MHTNFGHVIDGMDVVMAIAQTATDSSDRPVENMVIEGIELK
jgi:cyclophilin family peptidyl-prolyl cis-trans isomerase